MTRITYACLTLCHLFSVGLAHGTISSELLSGVYPDRDLTWLDNSRVVFLGTPPGAGETNAYLWDGADSLTLLKHHISNLCFDGAKLFLRSNAPARIFSMPHPKGLLVEDAAPSPPVGPSFFNQATCRTEAIPKVLLGKSWKQSPRDATFFDFGDLLGTEVRQVVIRDESGQLIAKSRLQLNAKLLPDVYKLSFDSYGYLVSPGIFSAEDRENWRRSGSSSVWYVSKSGEFKEEKIPFGVWAPGAGSIFMRATKQGLIVFNHGYTKGAQKTVSGAYLVKQGNVQKLISGYIEEPSVSPDGRRVAFFHQNDVGANHKTVRRTLRIITLD